MRILALLFLLWFGTTAAHAQDRPVTVFAAASLGGVLQEASAGFDRPVVFSFGGSGAMARQVSSGAPADLVILASVPWMDWLADSGSLDGAAITPVAANRLVVIGPSGAPPLGSPQAIPDRLETGRLAMGHRQAVPAGVYATEWLTAEGLWPILSSRLAETDNVRMALTLVARGEVPLGIVYATDALAEPDVAVLWQVPQDSHSPILYPAAALSDAGARLLAFLQAGAAQDIFARHGFEKVRP